MKGIEVSKFQSILWFVGFLCASDAVLLATPDFSHGVSPESTNAKLVEILKNHWRPTAPARDQTNSQFAKIYRAEPKNADAIYAYLLAKIRQNELKLAIKSCEKLLELDESHLMTLRAHAWLLLITRQHKPAAEALRKFDSVNDESKRIDDAQRAENVRSIGRMFGILKGPANKSFNDAELRELSTKLLAGADKKTVEVFEKEAEAVLVQYAQLTIKKGAVQEKLREETERKKTEEIETINDEQANLEKSKMDLPAEIDKLKEQRDRALSGVERRIGPIESRLRSIQDSISVHRQDSLRLATDINYYQSQADRETDPLRRDRWLARADRLRILWRRHSLSISRLHVDERDARGELARINVEYEATNARYVSEISAIEVQIARINQQLRKNNLRITRLEKPSRLPRTLTKTIQIKYESVRTYENFPLEEQRAAMIEKLSK